MGYEALVEAARAHIVEYTVEELQAKLADKEHVQVVDVRDIRELWRDGKVPGAYHAPRGMLEFWIDPDSPYHKPIFADSSKEYVFYCAAGWRSALAAKAAKDCGIANPVHLIGGFAAWRDAAQPINAVEPKF